MPGALLVEGGGGAVPDPPDKEGGRDLTDPILAVAVVLVTDLLVGPMFEVCRPLAGVPAPLRVGAPSRPRAGRRSTRPTSVTVTAHTYADLFDDELDNIAAALDSLDDLSQAT